MTADHDLAKVLRLGSPVAGTTNAKNTEIAIDADDVNALMLGLDRVIAISTDRGTDR